MRFEATIAAIPPLDERTMAAARARQDRLTKPPGSLGRLEELSIWVAGVRSDPAPILRDKVIVTAAADHGVAGAGVSAYPAEVTAQMVLNFLRGGAAVNVLARHVGARVLVVDAGVATDLPPHPDLIVRKVAHGTADFSRGPAMSRNQALTTIEAGIAAATDDAAGAEIIGVGDMGIGNTTASAAIAAVLTGHRVETVTGRGTGIDDDRFRHKVAVIEQALRLNEPDPADPLDVLAKVGGYEIAFLAGVMIGAAATRRPVVLDGFITGAAALIAVGCAPQVQPYLIASHRSVEPGHQAILDHLGLRPVLDLGLRLGEGTGAALAIGVIDGAMKLLTEMATFDEAGVTASDQVQRPESA
jgi:nicotinate-nucleotide--dimethylbenzimidazole phosphoribosyltransferase